MKKSKMIFITFVLVIFLTYSNVNAEDRVISTKVCIDGIYYQVSWDKYDATGVDKNMKFDLESIQRGYVKDVTGLNDQEAKKYKISTTINSWSCYYKDGILKTCPSDKDISNFNIASLQDKTSDGKNYKYITFELNANNGTYTLHLKNIFKNVKARLVSNEMELNNDGKKADVLGNFIQKSNGEWIIYNLAPSYYDGNKIVSNNIYVEFYIDDNSTECNNTFLGGIKISIPTTADATVANPALKDPNAYGCNSVKEYLNRLVKNGIIVNDNSVISNLRDSYVNLCYDKEIKYEDYKDLYNKIQTQFTNLKKNMGFDNADAITTFNSNPNTICENEYSSGKRLIGSKGGSYWHVDCWEEYIVKGDKAKLVYAGDGFDYKATFKTIRTCKVTQVSQVVKKPLCYYSCNLDCSWTGVTGIVHNDGTKVGPNEEFDDCIKTCDGGNYTQSCINSCYTKVYGERKLPQVPNGVALTYDTKDEIRKISTNVYIIDGFGDLSNLQYEYSWAGVGGKTVNMYYGEVASPCGTFGVHMSDYCASGHGSCTLTVTVGPGGCSDNPWGEYSSELSTSNNEYISTISYATATLKDGKYDIEISDSYLNVDGKAYTYKISSDKAKVIKEVKEDNVCNGGLTVSNLGDSSPDNATYCNGDLSYTKTVTIGLAPAYLNKIDGTAAYAYDGYSHFDTNTKVNALERFKFEPKKFYSAGDKYYTNVLSKNVNVNTSTNPISLKQSSNKAKIKIKVSDFGSTGAFSSEIGCFYGVYNDTYCTGKDCPNGNGIQFIFRPIELKDMFPNGRNPRWNWTDGAGSGEKVDKYLDYKVEPSALIADIEAKGNSIYTNPAEIDYEFELTPAQLRNIREDNKKMKDAGKTYVDYDMNCTNYKNREYCYSEKFLNNDSFVKFNISNTERINKAICNNTYGNQCTNE